MLPENSNQIKKITFGGKEISLDNNVEYEVEPIEHWKYKKSEKRNQVFSGEFECKIHEKHRGTFWRKIHKLPRKMKKRLFGTRLMRNKYLRKTNNNPLYNKFYFQFLRNLAMEKDISFNRLLYLSLDMQWLPPKPQHIDPEKSTEEKINE